MKESIDILERHRFTIAWLLTLTYVTCLLDVVRLP